MDWWPLFWFLVYMSFANLLHSLLKAWRYSNEPLFLIFGMYSIMTVVSSLVGAVLMNNSFLWILIGASYGLLTCFKDSHNTSISSRIHDLSNLSHLCNGYE